MKNIHILPTDKTSRLYSWEDKLVLGTLSTTPFNKNIYITSDEEIKDVRPHKGKWQLEQGHILNKFPTYLTDLSECKLVIMTTDQDLIKDGVQAIEDNFLEWFVKNPDCEEVEILIINGGYDKPEDVPYQECYEIIIPKQETKQERMYSEEEVYNLLEEAIKDNYIFELDYHNSGDYRNLKEWYETFKNK